MGIMDKIEADFNVDDYDDDEMTGIVELNSFDITPGTGVDCESCGYTPDYIFLAFYNNDTYYVTINSGCTGGGSQTGSDPAAILAFIEEYSTYFEDAMEYAELVGFLQEKVKKTNPQ